MSIQNVFKLLGSLAVPLLAGAVGSLFTASAIPAWYNFINKPAWNPPSWLFGPVWTTLYILMGLALFLVWTKGMNSPGVKKAIAIFSLQLVLNAAWSFIFFGLRSPFWALVEILFLGLAILWTIMEFYRISRPAAILLIPYLAWVSFATFLNYTIWTLN